MDDSNSDNTIHAMPRRDTNSLLLLLAHALHPTPSRRLYDAAINGDLVSLHALLKEDPLILHRCIIEKLDHFTHSPLHVVANHGHLDFVTELLRLKPELAEQRDELTRSTPLHLSSKKGHLDVVKKLLEANPNMCLARDRDEMNVVHVAAISNQLHVLDFLVRKNPQAAQERANNGNTLIHLCVKYAQLEPLRFAVDNMGELLTAKNSDGNTALHLAVLAKQTEAVKLLVANKKMQQNAINKNGLTAFDCLYQNGKSINDDEICKILNGAKAFTATQVKKQKNLNGKWLDKQRNALMVVASLLAAMAFQVGVNPPKGEWKFDSNATHQIEINSVEKFFYLISTYGIPINLESLLIVNTVSLVSALSVVLLLVSGLPCKRLFVIILMVFTWVAISATLLTYFISLGFSSSLHYEQTVWLVFTHASISWTVLMAILISGHIIRVLVKPVMRLVQLVKKMMRVWTHYGSESASHQNLSAIPC